jgi:hypothetical protein
MSVGGITASEWRDFIASGNDGNIRVIENLNQVIGQPM